MSWVRAPHRTPNWKENDFDVVLFLFFPDEAGCAFRTGLLFSGSFGICCRQCLLISGICDSRCKQCLLILALWHSVQAMLFSFLPFVAFGTGEGLLWYGICVPCSKRPPGVRDAFSEAFGVKNRRFRYGRNIRCSEQPPVVRDASWIFGTAPSLVRNRSLDAKKGHHRNNTKKQDKSCDLSCLVAGAGLEPTTSGL